MVVDSRLRWTYHIDYIAKKVSASCYAGNTLGSSLPLDASVSVYYGAASIELHKLLMTQKRMTMIFAIYNRLSYRPLFVLHEISELPCIYIYKILLYAKKKEQKFTSWSFFHGYGIRNSHVLSVPKHNTIKFEDTHVPMY